jgi:Leucine-rich repeat (LRR) protein
VTSSHLKEIQNDDFKFIPNLKILSLQQNDIEVVEKDSFKFNKNLEILNLGLNKIRYVHPTALDQLPKLVQLYLSSNQCIDDDELYFAGVRELIDRVKLQCAESKNSKAQ